MIKYFKRGVYTLIDFLIFMGEASVPFLKVCIAVIILPFSIFASFAEGFWLLGVIIMLVWILFLGWITDE